jgi:hypothetical protein
VEAEVTVPPAIAVTNLTKIYGATTAVNRLSFDVAPGEILGFPPRYSRPSCCPSAWLQLLRWAASSNGRTSPRLRALTETTDERCG